MSESLRNDGRVWVPKRPGDTRPPEQIPEAERDYYLERRYPSFGNLVPRDVASRNAKAVCDEGRGVGDSGLAVYLDFADAIKRLGVDVIRSRYGNLFDMYTKITDEDPYKVPMRIYPAIHYTMGGLWVDYNLMSTIPGLSRARRSELLRPRRQPARRERADAGAGRRLLRHPLHARATISAARRFPPVTTDHDAFKRGRGKRRRHASIGCCRSRASKTPRQLHRELGTSSGTTSGWRGTRRACGKRSRASRSCATSSGTTSRCRDRTAR